MSKSFALIIDPENDYKRIIEKSEKYYDMHFHNISHSNVSGIQDEMELMLDITPNKIHFMVPEKIDEQKFNTIISVTRNFISNSFENQIVCVKYYENQKEFFNDLDGVTMLTV
ncbi:hypothetical protein ACIQZD_22145 [Peribacillus sp. NPDC096447]|uniref:hypothetical protein n=1 Tax=Peribacillus sp. NPDC096447 TaxID=3364394 RepID=UPI00382DCAB3